MIILRKLNARLALRQRAELLNKSALCRSASLAFSFVQLHFEWRLAPASLHQRSGKTEPVRFNYASCGPLHSKVIYYLTPSGYISASLTVFSIRFILHLFQDLKLNSSHQKHSPCCEIACSDFMRLRVYLGRVTSDSWAGKKKLVNVSAFPVSMPVPCVRCFYQTNSTSLSSLESQC